MSKIVGVGHILRATSDKSYAMPKGDKERAPDYMPLMLRADVVSRKDKQKPNDACKCGSGKKFKKCCGRLNEINKVLLQRKAQEEQYRSWDLFTRLVPQKSLLVQDIRDYFKETVLLKKDNIAEFLKSAKRFYAFNILKGDRSKEDYVPRFSIIPAEDGKIRGLVVNGFCLFPAPEIDGVVIDGLEFLKRGLILNTGTKLELGMENYIGDFDDLNYEEGDLSYYYVPYVPFAEEIKADAE